MYLYIVTSLLATLRELAQTHRPYVWLRCEMYLLVPLDNLLPFLTADMIFLMKIHLLITTLYAPVVIYVSMIPLVFP